ncbi:hypothetical protein SRHO_G00115110 [Serrasalmus rhombeus]
MGVAALKLGHPTIAGRERQDEVHCFGMLDSHHMEDASKSHLASPEAPPKSPPVNLRARLPQPAPGMRHGLAPANVDAAGKLILRGRRLTSTTKL